MAFKDIKAGTYKARAIGGKWANIGKENTPVVGVLFSFKVGESEEIIYWKGFLTQTMCKSGLTVAQHTFDTLAMLGYNESVALTKDEAGNSIFGEAHLADKEVSIVIEMQTYGGKTYPNIRWVNESGGNQMIGLPVEKVLGSMNLRAELAAARARVSAPAPTAPKKQQEPQQDTFSMDEDAPF